MSNSEQYAARALREFDGEASDLAVQPYFEDVSEHGGAPVVPLWSPRPLVVDLDGTLLRSDLLIERIFAELGRRPHAVIELFAALRQGKSVLKHRLSEAADFNPSILPYDEVVLRCLQEARAQGRPVYLASASHEKLVAPIAEHLGLFDGWFATNEFTNLSGRVKAELLVDTFGEKGFDYIGNDKADLEVWPHAAKALAIRASGGVGRALASRCDDIEHLEHDRATWREWLRLMRVHQYAKNALVFVPLLTSQMFELTAFLTALTAVIAFSLCASSVYILNDLIDIQDDRGHRSKRFRPLAAGTIPIADAVLAVPILLGISMAIASAISLPFLGVLVAYYVLTTAYSFFLKRQLMSDVVALAGLYTIRVVGGAVAIRAGLSFWFLGFLMAWFLSLALIKRFVEMQARREAGLPDSTSRDYRNDDYLIVGALAAAAGFQAITLFVLYGTSDAALATYSRPDLLWLVAPVLTFWLGRALVVAHRGEMHDDPMVFALKDRVSIVTLAAAGALVVGAM